jgi:cell wall-associated NlpC family hydrolase
VIRQFQGQTLGPATGLLSADEDAFVNDLSTFTTVSDLQESLLADYNDELKAYAIRRKETSERRDQVADIEAELKDEKETVDAKLAEAEGLLDELEAEEREAILSRDSDVRAPSSVPAQGRAAAAIQYAMAQVGDAYVYGAAGPSAFDCSGLTMMAWAQAGVSLPHSSSAQYGSGPHISESQLMPGDLVFYYSPISHVEMYIGNGLIVGAANPGAGVRVADLHSMPYVGAVRPG